MHFGPKSYEDRSGDVLGAIHIDSSNVSEGDARTVMDSGAVVHIRLGL